MRLFLHFFVKKFGQFKKKQYLCTRFRKKDSLRSTEILLNGVMVALQILVLSVWVRVLVKQHIMGKNS